MFLNRFFTYTGKSPVCKIAILISLFLSFSILVRAQATKQWTPDNGNGTYTNPLMWGDWPDPDIIRVGDDFYFVSTSMHYVPGSPIAQSKDLVNWKIAGYAVNRYPEDKRYNMQDGTLYLNGSWANSIRYHNGLFYVAFCTPGGWGIDKGHFSICTAKNVKGPWKRTIFPENLYDPGLFFDDNGRVYVVHGQGTLFLTELNADALSVKTPAKKIWTKTFDSYNKEGRKFGMEGSHVYKINKKYYITCPAGGTEGWQICLRSDSIQGPYEYKVIMNDDSSYPGNGLHQGGMVQLKNGDWWFVIMQDRGPIGRVPHLVPVVWKDGWPMLGKDGNGKGVITYPKPNVGKTYPIECPATSDEFNTNSLGLQWQWNHNPDDSKWSLKQHPGYLSLNASYAPSLKEARNSLTQRIQGPQSSASVELDVSGLKDGDKTGLAVFEFPYAFIGVEQQGNHRNVIMVNNGKTVATIPNFKGNKIWLQAFTTTQNGGEASFSYSINNKAFFALGETLKMGLDLPWTANRFMMFNFNTKPGARGGKACFNWFHYAVKPVDIIKNNTIGYSKNGMRINGEDQFVYSAAFHYFRVPQPLWAKRFQKIKEAGFNTIETYIPWNWHERNMPSGLGDTSQFNFSELKTFLKMAESFGFNIIARPGPFICAEWAGGGYPRWLSKYKPATYPDQFWLRGDSKEHVQWSLHWFNAVNKILAEEQITQKRTGQKGVIMVQIENEYDSQEAKEKQDFLKALYQSVRKSGIQVPVFTCLTHECRGSADTLLKNVFDTENFYVGLKEAPDCAYRLLALKKQQPDAPAFVTELQGGWFSTMKGRLSEDNESDYRHYEAITLMSLLGGAEGFNTYMFVGGTNLAGWGARGMTTTYDYNAPIRENGDVSKKYMVAKAIGQLIHTYGNDLLHSQGGPCKFINAPAGVVGGIRIADNGTRFVFVTNTNPDKKITADITVVPTEANASAAPMYNINQDGKKVLVSTVGGASNTSLQLDSFQLKINLDSLGSGLWIIPPGKPADAGSWWTIPTDNYKNNASKPAAIRIKTVLKKNDDAKVKWLNNSKGLSLPELKVNDSRYVLYKASFDLSASEISKYTYALFNSFSRDIISIQVNGKPAKRVYPSDTYAAEGGRDYDKSFSPILDTEFDNGFEVRGLLKTGKNEIIALYENIGHEHGYVPMEELCGIKQAGLGSSNSKIERPLTWQVATNVSGIENNFIGNNLNTAGWEKTYLDTTTIIRRKGNNIQPHDTCNALMTWYRASFEIKDAANAKNAAWRMLISASGNGYIYLNGHNLGRYWEVGPQREFYLPECWLQFGHGKKNIIAIGLAQTLNGAAIKAMEISPY
jgi:beta-xylosidase